MADRDHPEAHCHRCWLPNVTWHAPSPLWNAVMRRLGDTEPYDGIVCPACFMELAEAAGVAHPGHWCLTNHWTADLPTHSPDGRVWNPERCLWVTRPS